MHSPNTSIPIFGEWVSANDIDNKPIGVLGSLMLAFTSYNFSPHQPRTPEAIAHILLSSTPLGQLDSYVILHEVNGQQGVSCIAFAASQESLLHFTVSEYPAEIRGRIDSAVKNANWILQNLDFNDFRLPEYPMPGQPQSAVMR